MKTEIRITCLEEADEWWRKVKKRIKLLSEIVEQQKKLLVCYRIQKRGESVGKIIDKLNELEEERSRDE